MTSIILYVAIFGELLLQFILELFVLPIVEGIFHLIAQLVKRFLQMFGKTVSWVIRVNSLVDAVLLASSIAIGFAWGSYVASTGQTHPPIALYSLTAVTIGAAVMALRSESSECSPNPLVQEGLLEFGRSRWIRLSLLNLAGAAGVALGYLV